MRWLLSMALLAAGARADSVLVLPFANLTAASDLDWIGVSVSQEIIEALTAQGIRVLDADEREEAYRRLSLRPYARLTRASVIKMAEAVDASQVLYGEFELIPGENPEVSRGTLRMSARLLDVHQMQRGPEISEAGAAEELARVQTRLAWRALHSLTPPTTPPLEEFTQARPAVAVNAIESYIRGLLAATEEQRHRLFTQAARLDPSYSPPCFQLGRLHWEKKDHRLAAEWLTRVQPSDPHYLEASFLLGVCRYYMADYDGAEQAFAVVTGALPLIEAVNNLGAAQSRRNLPAALESFRKALEADPADPDYHFNTGFALWKAGRFTAAADRFRAVLDRNPEDTLATLMLGRCLKEAGPRPGDPRSQGLERLKLNYEERAYRELKAALAKEAPRDNPLQ
ncbi:MAG: tetratricopeptide repeat protein [Acidobacteria bacterium]|nr:tetratricopeptide repeat protein [Acidobacteriota bacterium]